MKYGIRRGHDLRSELQRIAAELINRARALVHDDGPVVERIHEIRKCCKMLRALYRLVGMGGMNRHFRDIARDLSGSRDAAVIHATFETVASPGEYDALRAELTRRAEEVGGTLDPAVESRFCADEIPATDFEAILAASARYYHRGRKLFRAVRKDPTPDAVHEWRKRVKDNWYHMRLFSGICPDVAKPRRDALDDLQDKLGLSNDLVILREVVDDAGLVDRIDARREELVRQSIALGAELYKAKPKAFADSLRACRVS